MHDPTLSIYQYDRNLSSVDKIMCLTNQFAYSYSAFSNTYFLPESELISHLGDRRTFLSFANSLGRSFVNNIFSRSFLVIDFSSIAELNRHLKTKIRKLNRTAFYSRCVGTSVFQTFFVP